MIFIDSAKVWFLMLLMRLTSGVSFNQPKLCPNASWNTTATTFADSNTIGSQPLKIFITTNNTIYVPNRSNMHMIVWSDTSPIPTRNISLNSTDLINVFVTEEDYVYFGYTWNSTCGIGKWTSNSSSFISVMETCPHCHDVFIDSSNNIYCSMDNQHQVIRKSLNDESNPVTIVAGTGIAGSASNMLHYPNGLFVDTDFDLYVADCVNNRIQLFPLGQSDGITIAGSGSLTTTITLSYPTGIALDANKYLFIADMNNNRIVGSGPNGFRCLVGCNGAGSQANRLNNTQWMSFDTFGNIFVVDTNNNRIQKFLLMTNSCNETTASPPNNVTYPSTDTSNIISVNTTNDVSYNQPKLDPYAVWSPNAITFANLSIVGYQPFSIFINKNNTIYVAGRYIDQILIWTKDSTNPTTTIYTSSVRPGSIFVTSNGNIYTGSVNSSYQINRWTSNTNDSSVVAYTDGICHGIFVDINNTLYFSDRDHHKVLAKPLGSSSNVLTIVAGTGCGGNATNMLNWPHGIFVDVNFDLYVADTHNNRIQVFRMGELDAITVAGSGSTNITIALNTPASVVLNGDKYLFIADYGNNRIIGSGPYGFRCIVGCTGLSNSLSNTLSNPTTMAFDSFGNIYVVDQNNNRTQKFVLLNNTLVPSYNQPRFCSNATWNQNATTIANISTIGSLPFALFINTNNTIYAINTDNRQILIWLNESIYPSMTLYRNLSQSKSIFVTINNDIYVDNGVSYGQVDEFRINTNNSVSVMSVPRICYGLFVDISNTLYCSVDTAHQVFKKWLGDNITTPAVVAGTGSAGSAPNMLNYPNGVFVDTNFDLYVADYNNNRIQLFRLGNLNGITVAGNTSMNVTITLNTPSSVILDGNKYLFITDRGNNRIIGSDQNGFRCIVGCSDSSGSTADRFNFPRSIAFDSFGNLYVADNNNNRIQKFTLLSNLCNEMTTQQLTSAEETTTAAAQVLSVTSPTTSSPYFVSNCSDQNTIGTNCDISASPCNLLKPCENQGTCLNTTFTPDYICLCVHGFDGLRCQYDRRLCKLTTCWNSGICNETSNTTFECLCSPGWTGGHCELMINYCENITCENKGVCRPLFMNYTCDCLGESFSGRHCEIVSTKSTIHKVVSKSLGYIAIIFLISVIAFVLIMDVLKYVFGIDPTKHELERIQRAKAIERARRRPRQPVIEKFRYVNAPPSEQRPPTTKSRNRSAKIKKITVQKDY